MQATQDRQDLYTPLARWLGWRGLPWRRDVLGAALVWALLVEAGDTCVQGSPRVGLTQDE